MIRTLFVTFAVAALTSVGTVWVLNESSNNAASSRELPTSTTQTLVAPTEIETIVSNSLPAVVSVVATDNVPAFNLNPFDYFFNRNQSTPSFEEQRVGAGSGFFVSSDGLIVTNRHVVQSESARYSVVTNEGVILEAEVVARDPLFDVAILQVSDSGNHAFLKFGDSNNVQLGSSVLAIGNALGQFSNSVSLGIVSGLSRNIVASGGMGMTEELEEVIQTDAAINPGNSGGPLINLQGEVIGVNVAVAQGSENIGFALPSNVVATIVRSVEETGKIVRPQLGVRYVELTPGIAEQRSVNVTEGALILSGPSGEAGVLPDSPAAKAGLREGDIITAINDIAITSEKSLATVIRQMEVGETIEMTVYRDGQFINLTTTLTAA